MSPAPSHAVAADTLFDGRVVQRHWAVLVEGARIRWLGPRRDLPSSVPVDELPSGCWLAPGFIDVQVNGGGDVLFNDDPSPSGINRIVTAHRRYGTTALLPTLISDTPEKMREAWNAIESVPAGSGVLGIHFEGPFLSPERPGVHERAMIRTPIVEDYHLLTSPSDRLRLVTLAPEQVRGGFITDLTKAGVRVALGHSMATYAQTRAALAEGLTGFTHLFNAMRPLASREPGPIAAALECASAWFGIIVDGAHVDPAILRLALRGSAHPMLVTDAMPPVGGHRSTFSLFGCEVVARGQTCMREDGALAGSALGMIGAVDNCVRLLEVPLSAALSYASYEPANFLGLGDRLGRLAAGYQADMVALAPDTMQVRATWVAGHRHETAHNAGP
jgi:N-acetylglucosamine-6-phosphate deacetylase